MGLFNWFRNIGRKIVGGAGAIRHVIGGAYDRLKKVPVWGELAKTVVDRIPIIGGKTIGDLAGNVSAGIDMADRALEGDMKGVVNNTRRLKLKHGGMVGTKIQRPSFGMMPMPIMSMR